MISILIPCYNAERFIKDAVESALGQTSTNVEVVVVDDGSTDGSASVLESFADRIIFEAGPNRGACCARNRAFELCSGDFIQFLDADDQLAAHKIERQLPLLLNDSADVVLCKFGLFGDEKGERPEKRVHPDPVGDPFLYFANFGIGTPAGLYRRDFVERSGGFLPGLRRGQEADFHLRVGALNPRLAMVDEILVWVRMHDGERITQRAPDINQIVTTLIHQADFIGRNNAWTAERSRVIAGQLLKASRSCIASGDQVTALQGIRQALKIDPDATKGDRLARKALAKVLGVPLAESVINRLRSVIKSQ